MVFGILRRRCLVQRGFGLEVTYPERDAFMLETVTEHINKPEHIACVVECGAELSDGIDFIGILEPCPFFGLGLPDEADKRIDIQPELRVIGISAFKKNNKKRQ